MSLARSRILALASIAALVIMPLGAVPTAAGDGAGAVYTLTNAASANAVFVFDRAASGELTAAGSFATGGRGAATLIGAGAAVVVASRVVHRVPLAPRISAIVPLLAALVVLAVGLGLTARSVAALL
jgi:hypothetical protein